MDRINLYWLLIAALFVFPLVVVGVLKFVLRKRGGLADGMGRAYSAHHSPRRQVWSTYSSSVAATPPCVPR